MASPVTGTRINQNSEASHLFANERRMSERRKCDVRHDSLPCGKGQDVVCPTHVATAAKCDKRQIRFIDLFAGCGGFSEGFIQAGYAPVAHVEAYELR